MLKIWGRNTSINVQKVMWAIGELNLPHERIDVGGAFGRTKDPFYLAMNPNSLVPTLEEDDGFILWESNSIVRYLAAKHGAGTLWPADLKQRADSDRWMDWTYGFQANFRTVFWGLVRTPPEKRDMNAIEEARKKCAELLAVPDHYLSNRPYFAGNSLTIGDIPLGCHVQLWMRLPIERPAHPNLQRWFDRLCARAAYKKIVDIALS
jgi:glutathione S-transferase